MVCLNDAGRKFNENIFRLTFTTVLSFQTPSPTKLKQNKLGLWMQCVLSQAGDMIYTELIKI